MKKISPALFFAVCFVGSVIGNTLVSIYFESESFWYRFFACCVANAVSIIGFYLIVLGLIKLFKKR